MSNSGNHGGSGNGPASGAGRPDLGFADELDTFDPSDWKPKPRKKDPASDAGRKTAEAAAEKTGFRRRDPAPARPRTEKTADRPPEPQPPTAPARPVRRRRTGRNAQFNIKAKPETIDAFCAIADARGWGLGETLEKAVALMEETWGQGESGPGGTGDSTA